MRAKMEPFGLQNLNYTRFGAPFVRNRGPKTEEKKGSEKLSKKVTPETQGCAEILRIGGGSPTKIQRSDLRREENLMDTPLVPGGHGGGYYTMWHYTAQYYVTLY